jgi:flagellar biosynthesis/type III secretory pathway protein FliH
VLQFEFYKIQLKAIPWRQYLGSDNPLAAAILCKLDFGPQERVQVKLEFLRLMTRMRIDPARMVLLAAFFDSYLVLTPEEEQELQKKLSKELAPEEVKRAMEFATSWHIKGREEGLREGRQEGRQELLLKMLKKRLGDISSELEAMIAALSLEQLDRLAESLFDITNEADLKRLLAALH